MSLYPGQSRGVFGGLVPDRIAEHLVGALLIDPTRPCVIDPLATTAGEAEAEHLLTVCTRAASHPHFAPGAGQHLTQLCLSNADTLLPAAVRIATQVELPTPLLDALERLANDPQADVDLLTKLQGMLPTETQVLAHSAVALGNAVVARLKAANDESGGSRAALAESMRKLAIALSGVGQPSQALAAATEAIEIQRSLTEQDSDGYLSNLARILAAYSVLLGEVGRRSEALDAVTEATSIFRQLVV
ncbi:hypothetical protein [Nocardia xishanensis]|uniref:Tetratricopeptide repeat protein n=1 Tax=Nocardia xishanensis TaxID=238964 RepID=A0ABW7XCA5_9NOCA